MIKFYPNCLYEQQLIICRSLTLLAVGVAIKLQVHLIKFLSTKTMAFVQEAGLGLEVEAIKLLAGQFRRLS